MVTHTCGLDGDDLRITRHLAGKEDDGDEDEQRTEHIHVIRDKRQVIIEDYLLERHLVLKEIVHLLRHVKYDSDRQNQHDREKERTQKLLDYVPIQSLQ